MGCALFNLDSRATCLINLKLCLMNVTIFKDLGIAVILSLKSDGYLKRQKYNGKGSIAKGLQIFF